MKHRGTHGTTPVRNARGHSSKGRLERLAEFVPRPIPDGFDPACISWVTDRVGITAVDGVDEALELGYFVINVAGEIDNGADVKLPIDPGSGTVRARLGEIVEHMRQARLLLHPLDAPYTPSLEWSLLGGVLQSCCGGCCGGCCGHRSSWAAGVNARCEEEV